ncbi:MAG: carbon-nitrogen hydrolase family protein [Pseudomonadota bacterium]|nr:carbon-nitrogen hydrolase family protein [Pseudomonadota bacterium]
MRLALMQSAPVSGLTDGYARLAEEAAAASGSGADLLITPEMFLSGYNIGAAAVRQAAEQVDRTRLSDIARRNKVALLVGLPEIDGDAIYNSCLLVDATGDIAACYRKTHLFGDLDRDQFSAGQELSPIVNLAGWKVGFAICYDIEFPEVARHLALAGAEAILVPTANMEPFETVCTRLVPARAEENAVYVAYVNQTGPENDLTYCGLSCLVGPDGNDLARAGKGTETLLADLDRSHLDRVRRAATHLRDRRSDLY